MRDPLAAVLLPADTPDNTDGRVATVTSATPVEVTIAGGTGLSAAYIIPYTLANPPAVDDQVYLIQTKTDLIIIGKIMSGG